MLVHDVAAAARGVPGKLWRGESRRHARPGRCRTGAGRVALRRPTRRGLVRGCAAPTIRAPGKVQGAGPGGPGESLVRELLLRGQESSWQGVVGCGAGGRGGVCPLPGRNHRRGLSQGAEGKTARGVCMDGSDTDLCSCGFQRGRCGARQNSRLCAALPSRQARPAKGKPARTKK